MEMKKLDFKPHKSKSAFTKNYQLHDLAESTGKNLLVQWGIDFIEFGKDLRNKPVWEEGVDKPDLIIRLKDVEALLDWKAKHKPVWIMNKRAAEAYYQWAQKRNLPVVVVFLVFDDRNNIVERRFARLGFHSYFQVKSKQWDKNKTVEFADPLPEFNKPNLIKFIIKKSDN